VAEETKKQQKFELPGPLYAGLRFVHALRPLFRGLGGLESALLRSRLDATPLDRPIYICGVPRCGTTVTLDLLSSHPSVATHRYSDMLMPYAPYAWSWLTERAMKIIPDKPQERIHQDGIQVTKLSPEGTEEMLWLEFFEHLHSAERSCVLTSEDANPAFDRFYTDAVKKLVLARGKARYLSKANENVTRLLYLHRLFPDARFLLFIRHPAHHVASLRKTDRLFNSLAKEDPRVGPMTAITGHFEFGPSKRWARVGPRIGEIQHLYQAGEEARAWAIHWSEVYDQVQAQLRAHPTLAARTLTVRYEDLCRSPGPTIDRLLAHCELDPHEFEMVRETYQRRLAEPTYYRPDYRPEELEQLDELTRATRQTYGYRESAQEALGEVRRAG
jgi:hypothetical protein